MTQEQCQCCGLWFPPHMIDCKPERLAGRGNFIFRLFPSIRLRQVRNAIWNNENFTRMECQKCYGPGFVLGYRGAFE